MKKFTLILTFLICITNISYSQNIWQNLNCNISGDVYCIVVSNNGTIITGKSDKIVRSTNNGNTWTQVQNLGYDIISLGKNDTLNILYAGLTTNSSNQYGGVYKSTNDGISWTFCGIGGFKIFDFAIAQNGTVFTASASGNVNIGGVHKSTDNGNSWTVSLSTLYDVYSLWVDKQGNIYSGTKDIGSSGWGQLMKSTDCGSNWTSIGWYSNWSGIKGVITDNFVNIYCAPSGGQVYKSTNGGNNWSQVYTISSYFNKIPIVINSLNHLFIADYNSGVFRSTNLGVNWENYSSGLNIYNIYCLSIDNNDYLYAGCGTQVFKTINSTITLIQIEYPNANNFSLFQNYPNPFNSETAIRFDIPFFSHIRLSLYDITGREIDILVNKDCTPGSYEVRLQASYLTSGIYFYKMETEEFKQIRKLIILK